MKKNLLLIVVLLFTSCSTSYNLQQSSDLHEQFKKNQLLIEYLERDYEEFSLRVNKKMEEYDTDYYMTYLSMNDVNRSINDLFLDFGDNLGQKGLNMILESRTDRLKKRYLDQVQRVTKTNYEYYESPFLIFYKISFKKQDHGIVIPMLPYKILSFHNISEICLQQSLNELERRIYNDTIEKSLDNIQFSLKTPTCEFLNNDDTNTLKQLYEILKQWYKNS